MSEEHFASSCRPTSLQAVCQHPNERALQLPIQPHNWEQQRASTILRPYGRVDEISFPGGLD